MSNAKKVVGGAVALAALAVFVCRRGRAEGDARQPAIVDVRVAQTLGPVFGERLGVVLDGFRRAHPTFRVSLRLANEASVDPRGGDALLLTGMDAVSGAEPLFAGDFVVLAYDRKRIPGGPASWGEVLEQGAAAMANGGATYGIAIPDEPYAVAPLFGSTAGGPTRATAEEAFGLLWDARFARGEAPSACLTECVVQLLTDRNTAFAVVGEWRLPELRRALGEDLGIAPLPALRGDAQAKALRRDYGVVRALDVAPGVRAASDELVSYLRAMEGASLFASLGKVPLPLPEAGTVEGKHNDYTGVVRALATRTTAASRAEIDAQAARIRPHVVALAKGTIGAAEAAASLGEAALARATPAR